MVRKTHISAEEMTAASATAAADDLQPQLEQQIALMRRMLDEAPAAITIHDRNGRFVYANHRTLLLHGYDRLEEFLAVNLYDLDAPASEQLLAERFQRIEADGEACFEATHFRKDGSSFPLEVTAKAIEYQGQPAVLSIAIDITERKKAQDSLHYSQMLLNTTEELSGIGGWEWDVNRHTMSWTSGTYRLHELIPETFLMGAPEHIQASLACYDPACRENVQRAFHRCVELGESYDLECRFTTAGNRKLWIRTVGRAVVESGRVVKVIGNIQDITERKLAEESLTESKRYMRTILENTVDGFWVVNKDGYVTDANRSYCTMIGYQREEVLGMPIRNLESVEDDDAIRLRMERIMQNGSELFETYHRRKDGTVFPLEISATFDKGGGGRFVYFCRNLSDRYRWEHDLKLARFSLDHASVAIYWVNREGRITYVNQEAERVLGYNREELLSAYIWDLDPNFKFEQFDRLWLEMANGEPRHFESINRRKSGQFIPVYISVRQGEFQGVRLIFGFVTDISERKRAAEERAHLQAELLQAQKMESVGRLAGGVAHDFNNMLGVILGYTEMALLEVSPGQALYADLSDIHTAARRSADLTRQLLAFARKQPITPIVIDLNEMVSGMLKMLERLIGEDVELVWVPGMPLWSVKLDPSQIDQVLANLCLNARDAIVDVGRIVIKTQNAALDDAFCANHSGLIPGDYVLLSVHDSGCGMDEETLAHIFEPFFTTKQVGKGTGLGLSTVYGIVKQNNGYIMTESKPGEGSNFKIYLPRHSEATEQRPDQESSPRAPRGHETVLLVEDEASILKMATKMLEGLNYTVLAAATPTEAIRLAHSCSEPIHLLLTDLVMPDMNGRDLANHVLSIRPDIKCLFMSGYKADVISNQEVSYGTSCYIQKPFTIKVLAAKVREALT